MKQMELLTPLSPPVVDLAERAGALTRPAYTLPWPLSREVSLFYNRCNHARNRYLQGLPWSYPRRAADKILILEQAAKQARRAR